MTWFQRNAAEVLRHMAPDDWIPGRELRQRVNAGKWWVCRWSGVNFYAFLARLETEGLLESMIQDYVFEGVALRRWLFRKKDVTR